MNKRIVCVIPAYNEEGNVGKVIEQAKNYCDKVIVVDDRSTDATASEASLKGAMVVFQPVRCGVGLTLKTGLKKSLRLGADYVITLDGDGQHNPNDIPSLLKPLLEDEADIVIGSRLIGDFSSMPAHRLIANRLLSWLTSKACGMKISDSQSGFRAYNRKAVESLLKNFPKGYNWASHTIIAATDDGLKIVETPIETIYFKGKKGAGFRIFCKIFSFLLVQIVKRRLVKI